MWVPEGLLLGQKLFVRELREASWLVNRWLAELMEGLASFWHWTPMARIDKVICSGTGAAAMKKTVAGQESVSAREQYMRLFHRKLGREQHAQQQQQNILTRTKI